MPTKKNFSTIYLRGEGIASNGGDLPKGEAKFTKDDVRKTLANEIAMRLSEGYAMIEVAKELEIFTEEYAENVISVAKNNDTKKDYRKPYFKKGIYADINKALKKAEKPLVGNIEQVDNKPDFD